MKILRAALAAALVAAGAPALADHDHSEGGAEAPVAAVHPFAFATPAGAKSGGAYVPLENHGPADRLLSARSDAASRVEIHRTVEEGGVMRMREMAEGAPLPEGGGIEMAPGGIHIMLMGLKAPLVEGGTLGLTLVFESGLELAVEAPVVARDAAPASGSADHSSGHSHD